MPFSPPLVLVDNVFDHVNLYPNAVLGATVASGVRARPEYVGSYRRERAQWTPGAAAVNAGVTSDLGATALCAADSVWIDRGHNLWGKTVQIVSATNSAFSTGVTTTTLTVPAQGTLGGNPTSATMCVTEEGALYSLFTAHPARRYLKLQVVESWKVVLTGIILGARTQLLTYSTKIDEDAGGRVQSVEESDTGYQAVDRVYSYRTVELALTKIGSSEYDGTIRSLRRLLFERNQPAVVVVSRETYPERAWLYQCSQKQWTSGTSKVYRDANIQMRELSPLVPDSTLAPPPAGTAPEPTPTPSPPTFDPLTVPDMYLWYKADALRPTMTDGQYGTTWLDSSGGGRTANMVTFPSSPGTPNPQFLDNPFVLLNGMPAVKFAALANGTGVQMHSPAVPNSLGRTFIIVCRVDGPVSATKAFASVLGTIDTTFSQHEESFGVPSGQHAWNNPARVLGGNTQNWTILSVTLTTTVGQCYVGGVATGASFAPACVETVGGNLMIQDGPCVLGGYDFTAGGNNASCVIAEVFLFQRSLTAAEHITGLINGYLKPKYNL